MDQQTKDIAMDKLNAVKHKVAFPEISQNTTWLEQYYSKVRSFSGSFAGGWYVFGVSALWVQTTSTTLSSLLRLPMGPPLLPAFCFSENRVGYLASDVYLSVGGDCG